MEFKIFPLSLSLTFSCQVRSVEVTSGLSVRPGFSVHRLRVIWRLVDRATRGAFVTSKLRHAPRKLPSKLERLEGNGVVANPDASQHQGLRRRNVSRSRRKSTRRRGSGGWVKSTIPLVINISAYFLNSSQETQ